ncbi:hypothetical protein SAMN06297129_2420 [Pseudooceanicola antarcticus]|uniref:Lysophospholipase L1 n=1 Tax=Pseudooceanicola antarcticus TaxID=1247613 RepID=A0A285IY16_9RHOB|nr:DUF4886 domain-containing protein [Pseudooceanicola antarcticus]PJE25789.1 hypothetical protein CVM39_18980 [Pseudooceanicola antarcticus]SNY52848.1 hypothetical protein SAMN06297129_2420 [Pseudooceanicola antarcticus]
MTGFFRMTAVLALAGLSTLGSQAFAQARPEVLPPSEAPARVLFVGNSYFYYGDSLHNHAVRMARALYPERDFSYKLAAISGGYLDQQPIDAYLDLGGAKGYDLVILQGNSGAMLSEDKHQRFADAADHLVARITERGGEAAFYMTPAYAEGHKRYDPEMTELISDGYTGEGNRVGALVIPTGEAFALAKARRPEIALHKSDNSHPTLLGSYLGAATIVATLYDDSVVGNPYTYEGAISDEDAAFLQQVAEDAVAAYFNQ